MAPQLIPDNVETKPATKNQPLPSFRVFVDGFHYHDDFLAAPFDRPAAECVDEGGADGEIEYRGESREVFMLFSPAAYSRMPNWAEILETIGECAGSIIFVPGDRNLIPEPYLNEVLQVYKEDAKKPIAITVLNIDGKDENKLEEVRQKAKKALEDLECKISETARRDFSVTE